MEKTFRILRRPFSIQTQSVKVPPVSTAIRSGDACLSREEARLFSGNSGKRILPDARKKQVSSDEKKQHDRNDAVHGEKGGVQL